MPKKKNKTTEAYAAPTESLKNVEEQSIVTENVTALESKVEEPVLEEPAVEEPVAAEEPETEEPKVEEPVAVKSDNLNQRIAELDYLRECCGNWVGSGRVGKSNFLNVWENKSVSIDSSVNYVTKLDQLEKLPEIVKLWAERKVKTNSNHFKNIESYTLSKPLFNDKSDTEKVEVLEKIITLLLDCANGKLRTNDIEEVIDNLY